MLFPIAQMIEGREAPMCVQQSVLVRDALKLMMKYGYSHLPVVNKDGRYVGVISERSVARSYYLLGDDVPLLQLTLDHCLERTDPLSPEDDLLEACDRLRGDDFAVVIVDDNKPVGILTSNDLTDFFRRRSEDFIKVEDIEVTLRLRTRDAFPDDESMKRALMLGLGSHPTDPSRPRKDFHELSLGDMLALMTNEENWPYFNGMFEPLDLFKSLMYQVRTVRNQLAHFRGQGDQIRTSTLRYAMDWLSMRAAAQPDEDNRARKVMIERGDIPPRTSNDRWEPLRLWLATQKKSPVGIRVGFRDLELLLGGPLPKAARKHAAWWSNSNRNEAQVDAWMEAGWQVAKADLLLSEVTFLPISTSAPVPAPPVASEK